jgi:predicted mannosyl-3-phosphoglycerate phosphatase (HAD superfamily)
MKSSFDTLSEKHPNSVQIINEKQDDEAVILRKLLKNMEIRFLINSRFFF